MIERVWLIADAETGDASYVQHGKEDEDQSNWKLIGPFAFTDPSTAQAAAKNPKFLPHGVEGQFKVLEVESNGFVQAIFNGSPPSHTDAFMLDDGIFPLTRGGASWVDEALDAPIWAPLFDENASGGLTWLDRVLEQVAGRLGMNMETVQAIGSVNAAAEDVAAEVEQTRVMISNNVRIAVLPEQGTVSVDQDDDFHSLSPAAKFIVATVGMSIFGLPELEFREVPAAWVSAAGAELHGWAAYALDQGITKGDVLRGGGPVPLEYRVEPSPDPMWEDKEVNCLRLTVDSVKFAVGHSDASAENIIH